MVFTDEHGAVSAHAIETASGRFVDTAEPNPSSIVIEDISWALSRQARFAGHTISEEIWSIGQHCLLVENLLSTAIDRGALHASLKTWLQRNGGWDKEFEDLEFDHDRVVLGALLHDGPEAYLVDLPSPLKRQPDLRAPYRALETKMERAMYEALGLQSLTVLEHSMITWADLFALKIEASHLISSRGRGWNIPFPQMEVEDMYLMPQVLHWKIVNQQFLNRYHELRARV